MKNKYWKAESVKKRKHEERDEAETDEEEVLLSRVEQSEKKQRSM